MKKLLMLICFCFMAVLLPNTLASASTVNTFPDEIEQNHIWESPSGDEIYYVTENNDSSYVLKDYNINSQSTREIVNLGNIFYGICYYKGKFYYSNESDGHWDENNVYHDNKSFSWIDPKTGEKSKDKIWLKEFNTQSGFEKSFCMDDKNIFVPDENDIVIYDYQGNQVGRAEDVKPDDLIGVDPSNHNIYYYSSCNWKYWGYDHNMSGVKVVRWNGEDDFTTITGDKAISLLYQKYHNSYSGAAQMLNDKYLAVMSPFNGKLSILDSEKIKPENVTENNTTIDLSSGVYVDPVNLSNVDDVVKFSESINTNGSIGSRCILIGDRLYVAKNFDTVVLYDMKSGDKIGTVKATHSIYSMLKLGDNMALLGKDDNNYYLEQFQCDYPGKITIAGQDSLKVGESASFQASFDTELTLPYHFTSSNPEILSITKTGRASAWKVGTATITVESNDGKLKDQMEVEVEARESVGTNETHTIEGEKTNNRNWNTYSSYGNVVNSYLVETEDHSLMRVEHTEDDILVQYLKDGKVVSSKSIPMELSLFGGFYAGKDGYYLVFGQDNTTEDNSKEVIRVVKYDKDWNRKAELPISNINTYVPFDAGSLRMIENNGVLYIHTCHTMYATKDDSTHHQANMTFEVNEDTMTLKDHYSDVMNISTGYVSHSFNQFIMTDGQDIYRIDHGDSYPRGITCTRYPISGSMSEPNAYGILVSFPGESGDNYTGASIGGAELSSDGVLVAYTQDVNPDDYRKGRNVRVVSESFNGDLEIHKFNSNGNAGTPQLVKINDDHFLLMWMEGNDCKLVKLNADGTAASTVYTKHLRLSDCQPILTSDGSVVWYVSDGKDLDLFKIDPYDLDNVQELYVPVTEVSISKDDFTMNIGTQEQLSANVLPADASNPKVKWTSSNENVAVVDDNGLVTSKGIGKTVITITSEDDHTKTAECTISVVKPVTSLQITNGDHKLGLGSNEKLDVKILPADATNQNINWTSSNEDVASVDWNDGTVYPWKTGTTTITAQAEGTNITATCTITVINIPVEGIKIDQSESMSINVGDYGQLNAKVLPENASNQRITWSSDNPSVVSVDSYGWMNALKKGTATITATTEDGGKTASITYTVHRPVAFVYLPYYISSIYVGDSIQLEKPVIVPEDADNQEVTYASSDESIATVNQNGVIKGLKRGDVTITIYADGGKKQCDYAITVYDDSYFDDYWYDDTDSYGNSVEDPSLARLIDLPSQERAILDQRNDNDPTNSTFGLLQARVSKAAKKSQKLTWKRVPRASGYVIYGNKCGKRNHFVKLAETGSTSWNHKGLKKGTYYKYVVVAYANSGTTRRVLAVSKTIHSATRGRILGNAKKIKVNKSKVTLKKKKTFKLRASEIVYAKQKIKRHRKIAYESSNPKIATVSKSGKVKARSTGRCTIYAYAQNGIYKKIKVKVK